MVQPILLPSLSGGTVLCSSLLAWQMKEKRHNTPSEEPASLFFISFHALQPPIQANLQASGFVTCSNSGTCTTPWLLEMQKCHLRLQNYLHAIWLVPVVIGLVCTKVIKMVDLLKKYVGQGL